MDETKAVVQLRKLIFVSHATPNDNDFTTWLSVRLASAGYEVWSDLTQLIGGEVFWKDIEEAIRQHSVSHGKIFLQTKAIESELKVTKVPH